MVEKSTIFRKGRIGKKTDLVEGIISTLPFPSSDYKKSIHGSDAAFCPRKVVMHQIWSPGHRTSVSPATPMYFSVGNALHDLMAKTFDKMGILVANELRVRFWRIHGFVDDIIVSPTTGNLKIIDIKTTGKLPRTMKPGQWEQLMTYVLITGIHEASIIYISRQIAGWDGKPIMTELEAEINGTILEEVARRIATSFVASKYRVVLNRPIYRTSKSNCGFCPFKEVGCYSSDKTIETKMDAWLTWDEEVAGDKNVFFMLNDLPPRLEKEVDELTIRILENQGQYYLKTLDLIEKHVLPEIFEKERFEKLTA